MQTVTDYRRHLQLLAEEREVARATGLLDDPRYAADLADEIAETRSAYIGAAVTEIASLRAVFDGRLHG
jgi:hypothetical protein